MAEVVPALLLHLDDDDAVAAPQDEVELVAAGSDVRVEQSVAAEPIVPKRAALAAVHAAQLELAELERAEPELA